MKGTMTRRKQHQSNDSTLYCALETDNNDYIQRGEASFRKRRKKRRKKHYESFLVTNLKVGSVIAIIIVGTYALYTIASKLRGSNDTQSQNVWSKYVDDNAGEYAGDLEKTKIFPSFHTKQDELNAYNVPSIETLVKKWQKDEDYKDTLSGEKDFNKKEILKLLHSLEELKQDFAVMYGGENAAKEILNRGIVTFPQPGPLIDASISKNEGIRNTARRMFRAKDENKPFKLSFAGSSAVAGYGNYFKQTFPFVLGEILTEPLEAFGIKVETQNAAVADISSFPYGWCLENFMGEGVDVVSWDASLMNRADTDAAFEAYLRRVVSMKSSPMLVVRETSYSTSRRQLLQKYVDAGALIDPIVVNIDAAAEPFLDLHEDIVPFGFQNWLEFGAPEGAPGKVRSGRTTRLSVKQHELVAWLITMHFIAALELGAADILGLHGNTHWLKTGIMESKKDLVLPKPQSDYVDLNSHVMFGWPKEEKLGVNSTTWQMDNIYCRTTFEPIFSGNLEEIVVSGSSSEDIDLLLPRGPLLYNKNWVMNLGSEAKQNAFSFQKYDFDYRYQKKAYYGVNPSGNLTMFVPFIDEGGKGLWGFKKNTNKKKKPKEVFSSLILCEVNEHIGEKQCNMVDSMGYLVGGKKAEAQYIQSNGVSYQGKKICVVVNVPENAEWTKRSTMEKKITDNSLRQKSNLKDYYGLSLQISVTDKFVFWKDGPCSISHVIWEQK